MLLFVVKSASEFLDIESIEVTELDEEPLTVRYGSVPDENIVNVVDWSPDGRYDILHTIIN